MNCNFLSKASIAFVAMLMMGGASLEAQQLNQAIYGHQVNTMPKNASEFVPNQVIVKFKDASGIQIKSTSTQKIKTTSVKSVDNTLASLGISEAEPLMPLTGAKKLRNSNLALKSLSGRDVVEPDMSRLYLMKVDSTKNMSIHEVIKLLESIAEVEYAEPNYYVYTMATESNSTTYTSEPLYSEQWGLGAINMPALWDVPKISDKRPVIAIIDTGVDTTHPDLVDNLWVNEAELNGEDYIDDDGNGFVDDIYGYDFIKNRGASDDPNGHGTHCAGIAAAVGNNGIGITGTNPDALIMPIRVIDADGKGDVATAIKGIDYAVANGADVLSMSFGTSGSTMSDVCRKAYQSSFLVAAAGNDNLSINIVAKSKLEKSGCLFPAALDVVIGVMASDQKGNRASFSNYDEDGPYYTNYNKHGGSFVNYEVYAPGVSIMSTYPGGKYKTLNGTSMATPFVAGIVSRLLQTKERERYNGTLVGDIVHACDKQTGVLNAYKAHLFNETNREIESVIQNVEISDAETGDNDGLPESGETIDLYPTIRCVWGSASDIKLSIEADEEFENESAFEIIQNNVDFGYSLNSIGSAKSKNPIRIKLNENLPNNHNLRLIVKLKIGDYEQEKHLELLIKKSGALRGIISEDLTLIPDKEYLIGDLAVPNGCTLTIMPGTVIDFSNKADVQFIVEGKLICKGTPSQPIRFKGKNESDWNGALINYSNATNDTICNVIFDDVNMRITGNCILKDCVVKGKLFTDVRERIGINAENSSFLVSDGSRNSNTTEKCNLVNSNIRNTYTGGNNILLVSNYIQYHTSNITKYTPEKPNYWGTSVESIARLNIFDSQHQNGGGFGLYDLSNMLTQPNPEAHGLVWKVVVNGYDAQDEFEQLPPLGVGKQKFEVYFNRPMNTAVSPIVAMGAVEPYNQIAIDEDGSWSADSLIYTTFITIDGKLGADGLNRIYVAGAEDNEHFELIPEYHRFNVNVQATGSLSTGLMAEAGLGKVTLTWETDEEDFEDLLGYNIIRFTAENDTITINDALIDSQEQMFVDYNVEPETTYYYQIKQLTTSLNSHDMSNVVAATPLTAAKGDANGSMSVDVADVVTEVAYMTGQDPQPFIFEAADVNTDQIVNVLDVVGTVNIIKNPVATSAMSTNNSAVYTIEDGILYVESPVALGGVQFRLNIANGAKITPLEVLNGFETVSDDQGENGLLFFAFSMSGKTIPTGKHAILNIGDAEIKEVVLSDATGKNVIGINGNTSGIGAMQAMQMELPYPNPFTETLAVPYKVGKDGIHDVKIVVSSITGTIVATHFATAEYGYHTWTWNACGADAGIYFVSLYVDGKLMQTAKAVKK